VWPAVGPDGSGRLPSDEVLLGFSGRLGLDVSLSFDVAGAKVSLNKPNPSGGADVSWGLDMFLLQYTESLAPFYIGNIVDYIRHFSL
jgi:hypothetical protein